MAKRPVRLASGVFDAAEVRAQAHRQIENVPDPLHTFALTQDLHASGLVLGELLLEVLDLPAQMPSSTTRMP